jgi:hypothetical protein
VTCPHRRLALDLLPEAITHDDRFGFCLGRPGEDELSAGGRVHPTEDPHLKPVAALAVPVRSAWTCFRVGMTAS